MECVDYYVSGETFSLMECKKCGFLFTQHFPDEKEIAPYYETPDYISHTNTKKGIVNFLYHQVRLRMLKRKVGLIQQITGRKQGRILDIGAGTGYFPYTMKNKGWEVEAIEKNPQARLFAKENFSLDLKDETALEDFADKSFDVITLWHVMEHLQPINETWHQLQRLLDDKGILVVAVPNCSSYDAQKYGAYWAAYDTPRHLWHFTPDTIQQFGAKHGFILFAHYPMPYDGFYVSMLSEKYKKNNFPFFRGVVSGTMGWFHTQVKKERSSSIIYIFRKKNNG